MNVRRVPGASCCGSRACTRVRSTIGDGFCAAGGITVGVWPDAPIGAAASNSAAAHACVLAWVVGPGAASARRPFVIAVTKGVLRAAILNL